jgi:hypothetical protein
MFNFRNRRNEARLGDNNKFVYDEQLKMWVEEGKPPPAAPEASLPPPTAWAGAPPPTSPGVPSTELSARAHVGVRSRYVDTFNASAAGGGAPAVLLPLSVGALGLPPRSAAGKPALFMPGAPATAQAAQPAVATVSAVVEQEGWSTVTL